MRAREVFEHGDQVEKLIVVCVAEPAADRDGVLRVEDVARRRVVDDDGLPQVTPDLAEIFDVIALMVVATLPEKAMMDHVVDVELIE